MRLEVVADASTWRGRLLRRFIMMDAPETVMVHLECKKCTMTATCVNTWAAHDLWAKHMDTHDDVTAYHTWSWIAVQLPFMPSE